MAQNPPTKPKTIFDEAAALMTKRESLQKNEASLQKLLTEKEKAVTQAKQKFGRKSAEVMNGCLPEGLPEEDALRQAQADLQRVELAIIGHREQMGELEVEATALAAGLRGEFETYREQVLQNFLDANAELRTLYASFLTEGEGLAASLGLKLNLNPTEAGYPHPFCSAMLEPPPHPQWHQDERATALHQKHAGMYETLKALEKLAAQGAYKKSRPDLYPPNQRIPRQRYVTREVLRFDGKNLPIGSVLSAYNIPDGGWGLLQKMAHPLVRKIIPIEE